MTLVGVDPFFSDAQYYLNQSHQMSKVWWSKPHFYKGMEVCSKEGRFYANVSQQLDGFWRFAKCIAVTTVLFPTNNATSLKVFCGEQASLFARTHSLWWF